MEVNDPAKLAQADYWFFTVLKEASALNLACQSWFPLNTEYFQPEIKPDLLFDS